MTGPITGRVGTPTGAVPALGYSHMGIALLDEGNHQTVLAYGYQYDGSQPVFQVAYKGYTETPYNPWDPTDETVVAVYPGGVKIGALAGPAAALDVAGSILASGSITGASLFGSQLGIGTTSPSVPLEVQAQNAAVANLAQADGTNAFSRLGFSNSSGLVGALETGKGIGGKLRKQSTCQAPLG